MTPLLADLRFALRLHRRQPVLAIAAIVVLGMGLSVNFSVFGLFNAILLEPMPGIRDAHRLVLVGRTDRGRGFFNASYPDYRDLKRNVKAFSQLAAQQPLLMSVSADKLTERTPGAAVSANYFDTLHVQPALGRFFRPDEDSAPGQGRVAVISDALWQRRWQRDRSVLGRSVVVNHVPVTIVGVAEAAFRGSWLPMPSEIWVPITLFDEMERTFRSLDSRDATWLHMFGRLSDGASPKQADAQLEAAAASIRPLHAPDMRNIGYRTSRYNSVAESDSGQAGAFLKVMGGLTLIGLLVVCANVANLLLARASTRSREIAIRMSVGAGRGAVLRQMLVEGALLALCGIIAAVIASSWSVEWLASMIPVESGGKLALAPAWNGALLLYACVLLAFTTLAFALPAGWQASRADLIPALKSADGSAGPSRTRMRSTLAVAQVALCVILICAAGLLSRSIVLLERADMGIEMNRVLVASLDLSANGYNQQTGKAMLHRLEERLRSAPGIQSASLARITAFSGSMMSLFSVWGGVATDEKTGIRSPFTNLQAPGYFATLGVPLLAGRDFNDADATSTRPVAIVNESLARRLFPDRPAVGQLLHTEDKEHPVFEIVGVVKNGLAANPKDGNLPGVYLNLYQMDNWNLTQTLHVRASGDAAAVFQTIRQVVAEQDPNLPLYELRTMRSAFLDSFFAQRLAGTIADFSGAVAVLVATVGLYGLIAFHVARRTREIGVRVALGASPSDVLRNVLSDGLKLGVTGIGIGLLLSLGLTRLLSNLLYGVRPNEPAVLAGAALLLLTATLSAAWIPARRALRIDPSSALRYD